MSTVNATRNASFSSLLTASEKRLQSLKNEGVATIEIKSGYGLDLETEIRMLEVARAIGKKNNISVTLTFLGAHTIPPEFSEKGKYIKFLCDKVLPVLYDLKLVDAIDAYCEKIAFSAAEIEPLFEHANLLEIPIKIHADQLSDCRGAELAAQFGALSADHLEYRHKSSSGSRNCCCTSPWCVPHTWRTKKTTHRTVPVSQHTNCHWIRLQSRNITTLFTSLCYESGIHSISTNTGRMSFWCY